MNINEIPSYVKHSEVYKTLVKKNVKVIEINGNKNIPLFEISKELNFNGFKELLRTIYFWNIDIEEYPIEFYIFIHSNLYKVKGYLRLYKNSVTEELFKINFNDEFILNAATKKKKIFNC